MTPLIIIKFINAEVMVLCLTILK